MQRLAKPSPGKTGAWVRFPHPPPLAINSHIALCYHFYMALSLSTITDFIGITNSKVKEPVAPVIPNYNLETAGERKVLYTWDTVTIPQTNALVTPTFNRAHLIIGIFVGFLLLLMKEFMLIAAIGSIVFLWFVMSNAPSEKVTHTLSNHGVDFADQHYNWVDFKHYFFKKTGTMDTLCLDTKEKLPGRLFLMLNPGDKEKIHEICGMYLEYLKEEPVTSVDKILGAAYSKIVPDPIEE
jgi:hypothetical protein